MPPPVASVRARAPPSATCEVNARAALLAMGSAAGVLTGRALDGLGVLPGVHESAQVRAVALDPRWTGLGLLTCLGLGVAVQRLVARSRTVAILVLVLGQTAILAAPELAGRTGPEQGEQPLVVAVAVQLLLSLLTVTTVLLALELGHRWCAACARAAVPEHRQLPAYRVVGSQERRGGVRGRSPPRSVLVLARPDHSLC